METCNTCRGTRTSSRRVRPAGSGNRYHQELVYDVISCLTCGSWWTRFIPAKRQDPRDHQPEARVNPKALR